MFLFDGLRYLTELTKQKKKKKNFYRNFRVTPVAWQVKITYFQGSLMTPKMYIFQLCVVRSAVNVMKKGWPNMYM